MGAIRIVVLAAVAGLWGCGSSVEGAPGGASATPDAPPVTVQGRVLASGGTPQAGVDVVRLGLDPYLVPVLHAQSDANGAFSLGPLVGDSREWLAMQLPNHVSLYRAIETTSDGNQAISPATLLTDEEGAAFARRIGVTLDATRGVVRIPVVASGATGSNAPPAGALQVTFDPPIDVGIVYQDGEAIAPNVATGLYDVTVRAGGRLCAPAGHPGLVEPDGSVRLAALTGFFTVAPTMVCP